MEEEEEVEVIQEEEVEEGEESEHDEDMDNHSQQDMMPLNQKQPRTMQQQQYGQYSNLNEFGHPLASIKVKKLRNYDKIVTHPLFKHLDVESCGSAYFKDWEP